MCLQPRTQYSAIIATFTFHQNSRVDNLAHQYLKQSHSLIVMLLLQAPPVAASQRVPHAVPASCPVAKTWPSSS